jgi:hypothetical protein
LASLPDTDLPKAKSAGSQVLLNALRDAAKKGKDTLAASLKAGVASAAAAATHHADAVTAAETKSVSQIRSHVQSTHQQVADSLSHHSNSVQAAQNAEHEKLQTWHGQTTARAHEEVGKRQDAVTALGAEQAAQIHEFGEKAAQKSSSTLTSGSSRASSQPAGGKDERSAGHAEVANKLGADAASQFDQARPENEAQLRDHARDAADALTDHAAQAASMVGGLAPTLQGQVDQAAGSAGDELVKAGQHSVSALQAGAEKAHTALTSVEAKAIAAASSGAAKHRDQIHSAGAQAATGLRRQAENVVSLAQKQLGQAASHIASAVLDEKHAGSSVPQLQSQITKAFSSPAEQAHDLASKVGGHLATAAQEGVGALSHVPHQTAAGLASANRNITGEMGRVSTRAVTSIQRGMKTLVSGSDSALSNTASHLDEAVTQAKTGFAAATAAVGGSLDTAVGDISTKATDGLTGLQGRISHGQNKIDGFVAQKGPVVQRSILGDIGGWIADQFSDLWDMLSDPAFWVGLVVTIVLFPALGPFALVVGGAAGGAVAGIEQNVKQGKNWYDWHNIVRDAAIGAAAGAVMAVGLAIIEAAGLEGVAATLAVMGLSAGIGIVLNLVNGQRWDKSLLANLFLGWLFERVGAGRGPEVESIPENPKVATPDGPGQKPADPEPTVEPAAKYDPTVRTDAELAQDIDPTQRPGETLEQARARVEAARQEQTQRAAARGYCFVAGTPVQTPEGPVPIETIASGRRVMARADGSAPAGFLVLGSQKGLTSTLFHIQIAGSLTISATRNHPFFTLGRGWIAAGRLAAGDLLFGIDGTPVPVTHVKREPLSSPVATFNLHVAEVSTYFVGRDIAVWVHNADPKDPVFAKRLFWGLGAKGPRQRGITPPDPAADKDGASSWESTSSDQAGRIMGARVAENMDSAKSNMGAVSEEQLAAKGLVAVPTPGEGELAKVSQHHSIRPANNPDPKVDLTIQEKTAVQKALDEIAEQGVAVKAKPRDFGCG